MAASSPARITSIIFLVGPENLDSTQAAERAAGRAESFLFGPKSAFTVHKTGRFVPYAQWLFGGLHTDAAFNGTPFSSTDLAQIAGIGLDVTITRHWAIRPFETDYLFMKQPIYDPDAGTNDASFTEKSFRYSGGVIFRF